MIRMVTQEYREGDSVVRTIVVTFLCIPVFKFKKTSTNTIVVRQFMTIKEPTKINGFRNYE